MYDILNMATKRLMASSEADIHITETRKEHNKKRHAYNGNMDIFEGIKDVKVTRGSRLVRQDMRAAATNGDSNTKKVDRQTETIKVDDITPGKQEAQVHTITTTMTKAETAPTNDNVEKNDTNLTTTEKQVVNQKLIVTKPQEGKAIWGLGWTEVCKYFCTSWISSVALIVGEDDEAEVVDEALRGRLGRCGSGDAGSRRQPGCQFGC